MELISIAEELRLRWNRIAPIIALASPQISEESVKGDFIMEHLEKITYPWYLAVLSTPTKEKGKTEIVRFDHSFPSSKKEMALIMSVLAHLLRRLSDRHEIAAVGVGGFGFTVRSTGDDMVHITEIARFDNSETKN